MVDTDYSFFNDKMLENWAGPAHWKFKTNKGMGREEGGGRREEGGGRRGGGRREEERDGGEGKE
jgi:hypothetical protein